MTSPASRPAPSAGRARDRRDDHEAAVRPRASCRSRWRPPRRRCRSSRRCPRTRRRSSAGCPCTRRVVRYSEYGSSSAPIMPLIAPSIERLAVDVAAGVALGDRPVRVPERLERVGLVGRRARGQRRLAAERPARDEQRAPGEDGDDRDRDERRALDRRRGAARDRPRAGAHGASRRRTWTGVGLGCRHVGVASVSGASGRPGPASWVIE